MRFHPLADLMLGIQITKTPIFCRTGIKFRRFVHSRKSDCIFSVVGLRNPRFQAILLTVVILQSKPLVKPYRKVLQCAHRKTGMQLGMRYFMCQYIDVQIFI